ncbi:TerC family protein [Dellaglioa sp. BT-FLS60]
MLTNLYGPFFDLNNWKTVVESSSDWMIILSLAVIECLLSVDNAIVLAAQTQKLPQKKDQEKALFYGLWGAYIFRFIIIGIGTFLIDFWEIKVIGAGYLIYLSAHYFFSKVKTPKPKSEKKGNGRKGPFSLFWSVVISIEMMDIVFSIDSVLASLAISTNPVVVLIGGMFGILAMRGIATLIMKLMKIVPELESMAYLLIALIAVKLFVSIPQIGIEISSILFAGIVFGAIIVTTLIHMYNIQNKK